MMLLLIYIIDVIIHLYYIWFVYNIVEENKSGLLDTIGRNIIKYLICNNNIYI